MNGTKQCGKCNLCCKLLDIPELDKPALTWCAHCDVGKGCKTHEQRPKTCREFFCGYMADPALDEEWNPARAHFLLRADDNIIFVVVDPQRPDAWKSAPYRSALHTYASHVLPRGGQVIAKIGERFVSILPDREIDHGVCRTDQDSVVCTPQFTPTGVRWNATLVKGGR